MKHTDKQGEYCREHSHAVMSLRKVAGDMEFSDNDDNSWLISMSDVLSLLLVFFIMFLVMTSHSSGVSSSSTNSEPAQEEPALEKEQEQSLPPIDDAVAAKLYEEMTSLDLEDEVSITASSREVTISIKENVTFTAGEADILPSFEPVLDNIASVIRKYSSLEVDIVGHTDSTPINTVRFPSNWELSVSRSASVLKYFTGVHNIDPARLSIKGNADQKPVAPNDTPANRALNRRVEIKLKDTQS